MDNGLIRKRQKAKMYAEEKERIKFQSMTVTFDGANNPHVVKFDNGKWHCDCDFFIKRASCSHTMALEYILDDMLPEPALN